MAQVPENVPNAEVLQILQEAVVEAPPPNQNAAQAEHQEAVQPDIGQVVCSYVLCYLFVFLSSFWTISFRSHSLVVPLSYAFSLISEELSKPGKLKTLLDNSATQ